MPHYNITNDVAVVYGGKLCLIEVSLVLKRKRKNYLRRTSIHVHATTTTTTNLFFSFSLFDDPVTGLMEMWLLVALVCGARAARVAVVGPGEYYGGPTGGRRTKQATVNRLFSLTLSLSLSLSLFPFFFRPSFLPPFFFSSSILLLVLFR